MPLIRKPPTASSEPAPETLADALPALTSGSPDQRRAAARILGGAPGGVDALGLALFSEADFRVREAIFSSLIRLRSPASVEAVLPHLRADDANLRTGALDALRAMSEAVAPYLDLLLDDSDADVRLLACEVVRELPTDVATPMLCALLQREQQVNVCGAAVEVLAEIGAPSAAPFLADCAARFPGEAFLGFAIKAAAARIGAQSFEPRA